jgi:uncharacterized protein (DUF1778 family)
MPKLSQSTTINLRVSRETAAALALAAQQQGMTQKQVLFRALAAAGVPVAQTDLEDGSPRRHRQTV